MSKGFYCYSVIVSMWLWGLSASGCLKIELLSDYTFEEVALGVNSRCEPNNICEIEITLFEENVDSRVRLELDGESSLSLKDENDVEIDLAVSGPSMLATDLQLINSNVKYLTLEFSHDDQNESFQIPLVPGARIVAPLSGERIVVDNDLMVQWDPVAPPAQTTVFLRGQCNESLTREMVEGAASFLFLDEEIGLFFPDDDSDCEATLRVEHLFAPNVDASGLSEVSIVASSSDARTIILDAY